MSKRIYISADYSEQDGDREVIDVLHTWARDNVHKVEFADTAEVVSGSVAGNPDCRPCDLKREFNGQINASSAVIFVIGDKTKDRTAGSYCSRMKTGEYCACTAYKQNRNGQTICKIHGPVYTPGPKEDTGYINSWSYLEHEFRQAERKEKRIVIVYNSLNKQPSWLPSYMRDYEYSAEPFWIKNVYGERTGNYQFIKGALGYE